MMTLDAAWTPSASLVPTGAPAGASTATGYVVAAKGSRMMSGTDDHELVMRLDVATPVWRPELDGLREPVIAATPSGDVLVAG